MTWPLYCVMMFFMSVVWMVQIASLFTKYVPKASFLEDDAEVTSPGSASTACVRMFDVCVCVRASNSCNFRFFFHYLLFE